VKLTTAKFALDPHEQAQSRICFAQYISGQAMEKGPIEQRSFA
jgi:hypothetical protein